MLGLKMGWVGGCKASLWYSTFAHNFLCVEGTFTFFCPASASEPPRLVVNTSDNARLEKETNALLARTA